MDWGWVAQRTVELTLANIDRLRHSAASFLSAHPMLSGLAVIGLGAAAAAIYIWRGRASTRDRGR
jgi:hypothetical protein